MLGAVRKGPLLGMLLVAAMVPSRAFASLQPSSVALTKRADDGSECYQQWTKDPAKCPVVQIAFFEDANCAKPLPLTSPTPNPLIKGNEEMLFDGTAAHSLKHPFGSLRVHAVAQGMGIGFAKQEESDTVVQNMAYMSYSQALDAFAKKTCVTFPNLNAREVGVWTAKLESTLNQQGYVWNPDNIPIKDNCADCSQRRKTKSLVKRALCPIDKCSICLEPASWGGGGVLLMYTEENCRGPVKKQLYSTAQCTPLSMTDFKSYKAIQPQGATIDTIFSPTYYDVGENGYHACAQKDVSARPFHPIECQKMSGGNMFVGVYGNDPSFAQPPPGKGDKVLLQGRGKLLLGPKPASMPGHRAGLYGP